MWGESIDWAGRLAVAPLETFTSVSAPLSVCHYTVSEGRHVGKARYMESHLRQLIFSRKSDCLGYAVLLCLVCLFDLACFFFSSFSSLI